MAASNAGTCPKFLCMICFENPINPENCFHCNQFVCKSCIDKWCQSSAKSGRFSCPNCGKVGYRSNFKQLPYLQDLLTLIKDKDKELERSKINECSQHAQQPVCVYCSTCSKAICAQCISSLFNGQHIDHTYAQLNDAHSRLMKILNEEEKNFQSDIKQMDESIQNKKNFINRIQIHRTTIFDQIDQFQVDIKEDIDSEVITLLNKYQNEQNALIQEKDDYKKKWLKLKETIQTDNQMNLFEQENDLSKRILQRIKIPPIDKLDLSNTLIKNPFLLQWNTYEFTIEKFSLKQQDNDPISTLPFLFKYNQLWKIIVYPNGKDSDEDVYLCIGIELHEGISQFIDCDIIIELIHHIHDNKKYNYTLKTRQAFKENYTLNFNKFCELDTLSENGLINPETDSIQIRFKARPASIFEERKLLQWQIESFQQDEDTEKDEVKDQITQLQQDNENANKLINELKNKIEELEKNTPEYKRKRTSSNRRKQN